MPATVTFKNMSPSDHAFEALGIAVLTVSDSRTPATDRSGRLLVERLQTAGHRLVEAALLPDDRYQVRAQVAHWCVHPEVNVVLLTGGTGMTGRDGTPEAVAVLFDKHIEGFGELFRQRSYAQIGASTLQSRAVAGISNGRFIFCLPGSPAACKLAWDEILGPQLDARTRPCNLAELLPRIDEQ